MKKDFKVKFLLICVVILYSKIVVIEAVHRFKNKEFGPKIVGGTAAPLKRFPHAVQFFNLGALCGGVIIHSWVVLTSAHCLDNNKDLDEMVIQIGSKYIYDFNSEKYEVESFVVHEDYNKNIPFEHDIAMIFVKRSMQFGKLAKKAILVNNNKWMNVKEKKFIVTGWGWLKYGGSVSELNLMMAYLRYVPLDVCSKLHNATLSEDMFCLYGGGVRDTCRGDSGGGVLWRGRIVGLTSHGNGCAKKGKPSVYTNIWYLRHWIKKQMDWFVSNYCEKHTKEE